MRHSNPAATCIRLLALTNLLLFSRGAIAGTETNTIQRADEQAVVLLERTGQYDQAEARCMLMLQQNPNDPDAKRLLAEIEDAKHKPHRSATLQETLDELIVTEINFHEAGVGDVIDFLQAESLKVTGTNEPINFVWEAPESFKTAKVTLSLRQVPLADALKYVTVISGLRYRVDPHAVVIYEAPPPAPSDHFPLPSNAKSP